MADITHSTLISAKVHEPKHITSTVTGDAGKVITPSASSAGTSVLRSLEIDELTNTGADGEIYTSDGVGGGSWNPSATGGNTVIVASMSDFPTAAAGVRTLASNTDYLIISDLSTSDRFILSTGTQVRAAATAVTSLVYTGTGAMFSGEDVDIRFRNITFVASTGSFFAITSSTSAGIGIVFADNTVFSGATLGSISARITSLQSCGVVLTTGGLTLTATTADIVGIGVTTWIQTGGDGIILGSGIFKVVEMRGMFLTLSSGVTFLTGLANSGNITTSGTGLMVDCRFEGLGSALSTIEPDDDRWFFAANNVVRDTMRDSLASMQGNATETVIAGSGTAVKVAGTFVVAPRESGFTSDTSGRITYDNLKEIVIPISATLALTMASGGSDNVSACFALNGTVIPASSIGTVVSASGKGNITLIWQEDLQQSDFLEVWVQNDTDTTNIIVEDIVFRVN